MWILTQDKEQNQVWTDSVFFLQMTIFESSFVTWTPLRISPFLNKNIFFYILSFIRPYKIYRLNLMHDSMSYVPASRMSTPWPAGRPDRSNVSGYTTGRLSIG